MINDLFFVKKNFGWLLSFLLERNYGKILNDGQLGIVKYFIICKIIKLQDKMCVDVSRC